jgi:hypothetical protein
LEDRVGEELPALLALLEAHARERDEVHEAQHADGKADDERDAAALLGLDAEVQVET